MSNGQELVGTLTSENGKECIFESGLASIFVLEGEDGKPAVNLAPYAPFTTDKTITIRISDMIFMVAANDEITNFFKQVTGKSTIIKPDTPSIII